MTATVEVSKWRGRVQNEIQNAYNSIVDEAVLDACIEFCDKTRIWNGRIAPMSTIANIPEYKIRVPAGARLVTIIELRYNGRALDPAIDSDLDATTNNWETKTGTPEQYTMVDQNTARLIGIPTETVQKSITGSIAFKPSRSATEVGEVLWEDWLEAIVSGAKYRLFSMRNEDWGDPAKAQMHYSIYTEKMVEAKGVAMNRNTKRARRRAQPHWF